MTKPVWITRSQKLSTINESEFFSYQLEASDTSEYKLIAGNLPNGLQLTKSGLITGVPIISDGSGTEKIYEFNFTVRAVGTQTPWVIDRSFSLGVTNIKVPIINSPVENLGDYLEGDYIDIQISAIDLTPDESLTFRLVDPDVNKTIVGTVIHYPGNIDPDSNDFNAQFPNPSDGDVVVAGFASEEFKFVGSISGTTLTVTSIISGTIIDGLIIEGDVVSIAPNTKIVSQISGTTGGIGTYNINLSQTVASTTFVNLVGLGTLWLYRRNIETWVDIGNTMSNVLPPNLTLSPSGRLRGYLYKSLCTFPVNYEFQVEVSDGVNQSRKTFSLNLDRYYELDPVLGTRTPLRPILITEPDELPTAKHDNFFSFKFNGYDFYDEDIEYFLSDDGISELGFDSKFFDLFGFDDPPTNLPINFIIDPATGWLYGQLPVVTRSVRYLFRVGVKRTSDNIQSQLKTFILTVNEFGSVDVSWVTNSDLGTVYNGSVSNLFVEATSNVGGLIKYRLLPYDPLDPQPIHLPQGIWLTDTGLLTGRFSFRYFNFDSGLTTINDQGTTTFDETYNFTVEAIDNLLTTFDQNDTTFDQDSTAFLDQDENTGSRNYRTFRVRVIPRNPIPYENIYIRGLLPLEQRTDLVNLLNSVDWLPNDHVYRSEDPYYGRVRELKMLFLPGIEVTELANYVSAIEYNHYTKPIQLKNLNIARAVDNNLNPIYEIIYVEVKDNLELNSKSVAAEINLYNKLANFYKIDGIDQTKLYPNSFQNMRDRLYTAMNLEDRGVLPAWMTSVQENGSVLGLINAIPLVYVKPGTGKVALQLLQNKIADEYTTISTFNFNIDRYQVDNYLSQYWDYENNEFFPGTFTRFIDTNSLTNFAGIVDYAVSVPFEQLNNASLYELLGYSGISIVSPEVFPVTNGSWSSWMNDHAIWFDGRPNTNQGIFSYKGTTQTLQRDFNVDSSGIYTLNLMSTDTVAIYIDDNFLTQVNGNSITANATDFEITFNLYKGPHTIKAVMTVENSGSTIWSLNPKGLSILIYQDLITIFDTKTFREPKITFGSRSLRPGLDGASNIETGQKLIFAQQDNYLNYSGDNQGWNRYLSAYGFGRSFDQTGVGFSTSSVIPGLYEKTEDILNGPPNTVENRRAGIWEITIDNDKLSLTFDTEVYPGQYVSVNYGETYGKSKMYLNLNPNIGRSELEYIKISAGLSDLVTNFDGGSTRFIDNRDQYLDPGRGDKYVIYPKLGVFE